MGSCIGNADKRNDAAIDRSLLVEKKQFYQVKKLLFLGSGGSGKSTIFKQLKGIYGDGFNQQERCLFVSHIHQQCITQMKLALDILEEYRNNDMDDILHQNEKTYIVQSQDSKQDNDEYFDENEEEEKIPELSEFALDSQQFLQNTGSKVLTLNDDIVEALKRLWNEPAIKKIYEMRNITKIEDSSAYFWDKLDALNTANYVPDESDILLVRHLTTGVTEEKYEMPNGRGTFLIIDVGGQQSERRKWINCFDSVTAVIFVASLSCYDEVLYEDYSINSMVDQLQLFDNICNNHALRETSMILFLNKRDLFADKIQHVPLQKCPAFSNYSGNTTAFDQPTKYIRDAFTSLNSMPNTRNIFTHITCATDQDNIQKVFSDVQHIVIEASLVQCGLLDFDDNQQYDTNTIGLSQGGSKDVNNFRECIEQNIMPSIDSITYNGLLYEYYFDTKTRKHKINNDETKYDDDSTLFYPTYCYAKIKNIRFDDKISDDNDYEYYMSVGLNSNIKQNDFKRKLLNLVILVDRSGSMNYCYDTSSNSDNANYNNTKMESAKNAIMSIINQLSPNDKLGIVTFESKSKVIQKLQSINKLNMNKLKNEINNISADGGTNFESGYNKAIGLYKGLDTMNEKYDNRIVILTDAQPNEGVTDSNSLLSMVSRYASQGIESDVNDINDNESAKLMDEVKQNDVINHVYATFIGVGLDFNSSLIQSISETRGCNYYSVISTDDFNQTMAEEFEYMVTPLVFDVSLKLKCEGNSCEIDKVYGSNKDIYDGEIVKIHTLFPSKKSKEKGGTKGGIQLIKLKRIDDNYDNDINVELEVTFEDRNGNKYKNIQNVTFISPSETAQNDMIEIDEKELDEMNINFYDNTGIRKAILLCKYVEIIKQWIESEEYTSRQLQISDNYKQILMNFMNHFKHEMIQCNDNSLQKELDVINNLLNLH